FGPLTISLLREVNGTNGDACFTALRDRLVDDPQTARRACRLLRPSRSTWGHTSKGPGRSRVVRDDLDVDVDVIYRTEVLLIELYVRNPVASTAGEEVHSYGLAR